MEPCRLEEGDGSIQRHEIENTEQYFFKLGRKINAQYVGGINNSENSHHEICNRGKPKENAR